MNICSRQHRPLPRIDPEATPLPPLPLPAEGEGEFSQYDAVPTASAVGAQALYVRPDDRVHGLELLVLSTLCGMLTCVTRGHAGPASWPSACPSDVGQTFEDVFVRRLGSVGRCPARGLRYVAMAQPHGGVCARSLSPSRALPLATMWNLPGTPVAVVPGNDLREVGIVTASKAAFGGMARVVALNTRFVARCAKQLMRVRARGHMQGCARLQ